MIRHVHNLYMICLRVKGAPKSFLLSLQVSFPFTRYLLVVNFSKYM